jgi:adenylosuccinate synthase
MPATVVVGTQWGDEGKGKIVDFLAEDYHLVARFQGGDNAGHTVAVGKKEFRFHLIPSGVVRGKKVVLGNGMVINQRALMDEKRRMEENGIQPNMVISKKAHVIFPFHQELDGIQEKTKGKKKIGTTKRGIGPTYTDKTSRVGIRMADLADEQTLALTLSALVEQKNRVLESYGEPLIDYEETLEEYSFYGRELKPFLGDASLEVNTALDKQKKVLIEGAQGTLLDIDHGTYPFVTSSNTIAGGACSGLGLGPKRIDEIVGITKAYTTRVGGGPFPTELIDDTGKQMQEQGNEYGTTTGRPRRCGWFDAVIVKYSCRVNSIDWLALTKLDVLTDINPLRVCVEYENRVTGEKTREFPQTLEELAECDPVYKELPGWEKKDFDGKTLKGNALEYVKKLEKLCDTPIKIVSTGPGRKQTIVLE